MGWRRCSTTTTRSHPRLDLEPNFIFFNKRHPLLFRIIPNPLKRFTPVVVKVCDNMVQCGKPLVLSSISLVKIFHSFDNWLKKACVYIAQTNFSDCLEYVFRVICLCDDILKFTIQQSIIMKM